MVSSMANPDAGDLRVFRGQDTCAFFADKITMERQPGCSDMIASETRHEDERRNCQVTEAALLVVFNASKDFAAKEHFSIISRSVDQSISRSVAA